MDPGDDRRSAPRGEGWRRRHHDAIYALARAAEARDRATGDHVLRIRGLVALLAGALGVPDAEDLGYDAMLHDVGKLMVPESILSKAGPLTAEERLEMEAHTLRGFAFLRDAPTMARAARIARAHHERWEGGGYPDGIAGTSIPIEARIVAAADLLDALAHERSYKAAWRVDDAIERVREESGRGLDPQVVDALLACHASGTLLPVLRPLRRQA